MFDTYGLYKIFELIACGTKDIRTKHELLLLRRSEISKLIKPMIKLAFDTRRLNQEIQYNPRRNIQFYHRSEPFISEAFSSKLKSLQKLKEILDELNLKYGKEPEWQDSNCRILLSRLENGLRSNIQDGDHTEVQPGTGSIDYIEELLYIRYRLNCENIDKLSKNELEKILLSKDDELTHIDSTKSSSIITKSDIGKYGYDTLLEKLFTMSSDDSQDSERIITISIRNKIHKES